MNPKIINNFILPHIFHKHDIKNLPTNKFSGLSRQPNCPLEIISWPLVAH